jgi:hypothetical protein
MAALNRPIDDQGPPPTLYLLFAGRHGNPTPGIGSLVGAFASHDDACAAFRHARLRLSDREGWAELTVVAEGARPRIVRWFGEDRPSRSHQLSTLLSTSGESAGTPSRRRSRFRVFARRSGG